MPPGFARSLPPDLSCFPRCSGSPSRSLDSTFMEIRFRTRWSVHSRPQLGRRPRQAPALPTETVCLWRRLARTCRGPTLHTAGRHRRVREGRGAGRRRPAGAGEGGAASVRRRTSWTYLFFPGGLSVSRYAHSGSTVKLSGKLIYVAYALIARAISRNVAVGCDGVGRLAPAARLELTHRGWP